MDCFENIAHLRAVIHSSHYPNTAAVIHQLNQPPVQQHQWHTYAMNCVQSGIRYFLEKFGNYLEKPLSIFKAARLFSPITVHEIHPASSDLDELKVFLSQKF